MRVGKKKLFNLIGLGVVIVWLGMMGVLIKKSRFTPGPITPAPESKTLSLEKERETWMAIFHEEEKIGFARSSIRQEASGYRVSENAVVHLRAIGEVHRVSTEMIGLLNADTSLRSFVFLIDSGLVRFQATGRVEERHLILKTDLGGEKKESRLLLDQPVFLPVGLWPFILKQSLHVGARYELNLFDPSVMAQKPVRMEVLAKEPLAVHGRSLDAYKIKMSFSGLDTLIWLDAHGERLKEEGLMGLRMVKTTEDEAQSGIQFDPGTDIAEAVSIASNKILPDPSSLTYLKIQLGGISLNDFDLNSGRQRLTGSVLEINREPAASQPTDQRFDPQPYLAESPFVQSGHPEIKSLSDDIAGRVENDRTKAQRILDWVFQSIEKRATVSVPNALDTLRSGAGDCNEHAVLFAALARAAGIPTKISAGLVYTRGRFYYHAWNEVFHGQWVSVDALMGQMPADVTHIRFIEGDLNRQVEMVRVIGRVKITVLETG